jgi:5-bromo-4-chloroindolyl phosphate hydrolysis protein
VKKPVQPERRLTAADVDIINRNVDQRREKLLRLKEALMEGDDAEALRRAREYCGLTPETQG